MECFLGTIYSLTWKLSVQEVFEEFIDEGGDRYGNTVESGGHESDASCSAVPMIYDKSIFL